MKSIGSANKSFGKRKGESVMRKQAKSPDEQIKTLCDNIKSETQHWIDMNEHGCWDPSWPDGTNMNLVRRHIIWSKTNIMEICVKNGCPLPEEYFSPVPPEVIDFYMADPKRVENMIVRPAVVTTVKAKFDQKQLAFA